MKFYRAFFQMILSRPRLALAALYWHVTGRKVRARNRLRIATAQSPHAYRIWIETIEPNRPAPVLPDLPPNQAPLISVMGKAPSPAQMAALERQSFADWEWAADMAAARGAWILPLPDGAILPRDALARYAEAIGTHSDADVLYGDHDEIGSTEEISGTGTPHLPFVTKTNRQRPWFKPEWNPDMFLAQDYLTQACAIRTTRLRETLPGLPLPDRAHIYAALLTIGSAKARVVHSPHILAHLPQGTTYLPQAAQLDAVKRHIAPMGATAQPGPFGTVRVEWPLPDAEKLPLVSIIIPTRDRVELLRCCLEGVLNGTDYPRLEVIVVDNGSRESATLAYLAEIARDSRVSVLRDDGDFNFSRLNNRAAEQAQGAFLCLLNNDIEIITSDWLTALMRQVIRPGVGAVGAKLLYDDGTIQHAGVVIGIKDAAGHAHRFQDNRPRAISPRPILRDRPAR